MASLAKFTQNGNTKMVDEAYARDVSYVVETQCTSQKFMPALKLTNAKALVLEGKLHPQDDGSVRIEGSTGTFYTWTQQDGCTCPQATAKHAFCYHAAAVEILQMTAQYQGKKLPRPPASPPPPVDDWPAEAAPHPTQAALDAIDTHEGPSLSDEPFPGVEDVPAAVLDVATGTHLPAVVETLPMLSSATLGAQIQAWTETRALLTAYIKQHLHAGVDYYTLKLGGKETRPSLSKAGSEKFLVLFRLQASFSKDSDTWDMLGSPAGILCYKCVLTTAAGQVVGEGRGARDIRKDSGDINKAIKMSQKCAQVDAVLRTGALSDCFTQDLEDEGDAVPTPAAPQTPSDTRTRVRQLLTALGEATDTVGQVREAVVRLTGLELSPEHMPLIATRLAQYQTSRER